MKSGKRVTQEKVAAAAPQVGQGSPERMLRRERLPHDEADALDVGAAAGELGREGQELLVEEALRVEGAEQLRPALDEDQLAGARIYW